MLLLSVSHDFLFSICLVFFLAGGVQNGSDSRGRHFLPGSSGQSMLKSNIIVFDGRPSEQNDREVFLITFCIKG